MDILKMLEEAAAEIRNARQSAENNKLFHSILAVRIAVSQLNGNKIDYSNVGEQQWNKLVNLAETGRLTLCGDGTVLIDMGVLTPERFAEKTKNDL
jgi:hypothetical protein